MSLSKLTFLLLLISQVSDLAAQKETKFLGDQTTKIQSPFKLRDPFKQPQEKIKSSKKKIFQFTNKDFYTNREPISDIRPSSIKVIGVLLGEKRKAIAEIEGRSGTTMLEEGMVLGKNNVKVSAIVPGGIVLVEKLINVYDQVEYLETIIPISEE